MTCLKDLLMKVLARRKFSPTLDERISIPTSVQLIDGVQHHVINEMPGELIREC